MPRQKQRFRFGNGGGVNAPRSQRRRRNKAGKQQVSTRGALTGGLNIVRDNRSLMRLTTERVTDPGFADRAMITMRFVSGYTLTYTASSATQYLAWYANGAYQPGTPQSDTATPSYWAKYAAAYNYYRVHRSRIVLFGDCLTNNATTGDFRCALAASTNGSPSSAFVLNQTPGYREWLVSGATDAAFAPTAVSQELLVRKVLGQVQAEYLGDNTNRAAVNAVPAVVCDWVMSVTPTGSSATATFNVKATLEFDVEFYDRIFLSDTSLLLRQAALTNPKLLAKREGKKDELLEEGKAIMESKEHEYGSMDGQVDDDGWVSTANMEFARRTAGWTGPAGRVVGTKVEMKDLGIPRKSVSLKG